MGKQHAPSINIFNQTNINGQEVSTEHYLLQTEMIEEILYDGHATPYINQTFTNPCMFFTTHAPSFRNTMHNDDTKLVWYAWEMLRSALCVYILYQRNKKIYFSWWYSAQNEIKPYRKTHRLGYVNMFAANLKQYSRFNGFGVDDGHLTHCGPVDFRKWAIFNTILMSPKSWLSQEDLDAGCEHSLVPMDS